MAVSVWPHAQRHVGAAALSAGRGKVRRQLVVSATAASVVRTWMAQVRS